MLGEASVGPSRKKKCRDGGLDPPWRDLTRLWCSKCHDGGLDPPWRTRPTIGAASVTMADLTRLGGLDPLLVHAMCANVHVAACMVNVRGRHLFNRMDPLVR